MPVIERRLSRHFLTVRLPTFEHPVLLHEMSAAVPPPPQVLPSRRGGGIRCFVGVHLSSSYVTTSISGAIDIYSVSPLPTCTTFAHPVVLHETSAAVPPPPQVSSSIHAISSIGGTDIDYVSPLPTCTTFEHPVLLHEMSAATPPPPQVSSSILLLLL